MADPRSRPPSGRWSLAKAPCCGNNPSVPERSVTALHLAPDMGGPTTAGCASGALGGRPGMKHRRGRLWRAWTAMGECVHAEGGQGLFDDHGLRRSSARESARLQPACRDGRMGWRRVRLGAVGPSRRDSGVVREGPMKASLAIERGAGPPTSITGWRSSYGHLR
jgi:hypothetical protein